MCRQCLLALDFGVVLTEPIALSNAVCACEKLIQSAAGKFSQAPPFGTEEGTKVSWIECLDGKEPCQSKPPQNNPLQCEDVEAWLSRSLFTYAQVRLTYPSVSGCSEPTEIVPPDTTKLSPVEALVQAILLDPNYCDGWELLGRLWNASVALVVRGRFPKALEKVRSNPNSAEGSGSTAKDEAWSRNKVLLRTLACDVTRERVWLLLAQSMRPLDVVNAPQVLLNRVGLATHLRQGFNMEGGYRAEIGGEGYHPGRYTKVDVLIKGLESSLLVQARGKSTDTPGPGKPTKMYVPRDTAVGATDPDRDLPPDNGNVRESKPREVGASSSTADLVSQIVASLWFELSTILSPHDEATVLKRKYNKKHCAAESLHYFGGNSTRWLALGIMLHQGEVLSVRGQHVNSLKCVRKALEIDPANEKGWAALALIMPATIPSVEIGGKLYAREEWLAKGRRYLSDSKKRN